MTYTPKYTTFKFEDYNFDPKTLTALFTYSFDDSLKFQESVTFENAESYDESVLNNVLFLTFVIAGISYYKCFPTQKFDLNGKQITSEQATFFTTVYRHGLSQYVYENKLSPDDIGVFESTSNEYMALTEYAGSGVSVLQSGGKDSLLLAELLRRQNSDLTALYMQQSEHYPAVIDTIGISVRRFRRSIDKVNLTVVEAEGARNGHVPVTYITLAYALVDIVLRNANTVLAAIGREGEEPHAYIGSDYPVTHQWSKTWRAEQLFSGYVSKFISSNIFVGSPLRGLAELKIAELFVEHCWQKYGRSFSSCNLANYQQGHNNTHLTWCSNCPKCANSFLLFAPFVDKSELYDIFGEDLFVKEELTATFKGLLGIEDYSKPFECVGEIAELRKAYLLSQSRGYSALPFNVPESDFDKEQITSAQAWAAQMIQ